MHVIHLSDYSFSPADLTIDVGDSVKAVVDTGTHTFTSSGGPKGWDSGGMGAGQSYTVRFTTPGSYTFLCSYHSTLGMTGKLTVR